LQIVLVGQPELEMKLRQTSLRQVTERIAVRCNINPLTRAESLRYVEHRLQRAGGSTSAIFTTPALEFIVLKSGGIPRRINILCHTAMLFAYGRGEQLVTFPMARAAAREKEGRGLVTIRRGLRATLTTPHEEAEGLRFRPWWAVAGFAAGIVVMLGLGSLDGRPGPTAALEVPVAGPVADDADAMQRARADKRLNDAIETLAEAIALRNANGDADDAAQHAPEETSTEQPTYREIRVRRGTTLRALVKEIYGEDTPGLIDRIKSANPQIVNADRIVAGDTLRFPESSSARE
jgi:hypothetical protein